jgi:two-component system chemotaxis response regulator CheB
LLKALDPPVCPVVIALHSPKEHADSLAQHLGTVSGHRVLVGAAGPLPPSGIILLPGGIDHGVVATAEGLSLRWVRGGASNFHPNGDILLSSMAELDRPVVGVILTGMGNDGCEGAKSLKAHGYPVLAQSPASCIVAGMPSAAIAAGAISETAPPEAIAMRLNIWFALPEG